MVSGFSFLEFVMNFRPGPPPDSGTVLLLFVLASLKDEKR